MVILAMLVSCKVNNCFGSSEKVHRGHYTGFLCVLKFTVMTQKIKSVLYDFPAGEPQQMN